MSTPASSSRRSARTAPFPEGTVAVGVGLLLSGICAYAFIAAANRALSIDQVTALQVLWFSTFALAPGFFLPLEQEVGRALSHRRALGQGGLPVVKRAAALGGVLVLALLVAIAALTPLLIDSVFHGNGWLIIGLATSVAAFGATHLVRGVLSGNHRFQRYGLLLAIDGLLRVAGCLCFWALGVEAVGAYGLLIGLPAVVALVLALRSPGDLLHDGPPAPLSEVTAHLGWLLLGSVPAAFLVNAGPIAANLLDNVDNEKIKAFTNGVLISRVPLFMFQAVQAALLPKLARLAAAGQLDEFRNGFRRLMTLVLAVGVVGVVGAGLLGPFVLRTLFADDLDATHLALLALAASLYMVATALAQAIIALRGHAKVGIGWTIGLLAFLVALVPRYELLARIEIALVIGSAAAAAVFAVSLRSKLHGAPS